MGRNPLCPYDHSIEIGPHTVGLSTTRPAYVTMEACNNGGKLLVDLFYIVQLDVFHIHDNPDKPPRAPSQVFVFTPSLQPG